MGKGCGIVLQLSGWSTQTPAIQGMGGYTVEHGCHIAHGNWLPDEHLESSNWREL